jgi:hypothetical protein
MQSVSSLRNSVPLLEIMSVSEFLRAKVSTSMHMHKDRLAYIAWPDRVKCTRNFMDTVEQKGTPQNATEAGFALNLYVRLAQVCARACAYAVYMHACVYVNIYIYIYIYIYYVCVYIT